LLSFQEYLLVACENPASRYRSLHHAAHERGGGAAPFDREEPWFKGCQRLVRILLALELEPWFRMRAKSNQRRGGREKGSSQLTEADRLDVHRKISRVAGVSVGNVSTVKRILVGAVPELQ
jgi:hypothetical protein